MHSFLNKKLIASIVVGSSLIGAANPIFALNNDDFKTNSSNEESSNGDSSEDNSGDTSNGEDTGKDESDDDSGDNSDDNTNTETKLTLISDITKENEGKECTVTATVNSLNNNIVNVSDSSGSGNLYLEFSLESSLKEGDIVIAKGTIKYLNEQAYLFIESAENLTIEENFDSSDSNENGDEQNNTNSSGQKPSINTESNKTPTLPQNQNGTNNQNTNIESTTPSVYARSYIYINYDLSSSQWKSIKTALENKKIKVRDLKDNQIMIKKVSDGYGDRVWIVNDPRELDKESVETTRTIGEDIAQSIDYNDYGLKESTWKTILSNVQNGNAKLKLTRDGDIKIIYSKSSKKDTTTTYYKK